MMANMNMDDTLIAKLVGVEQDALRDKTGQPENTVPTCRPVAYTARGQVD